MLFFLISILLFFALSTYLYHLKPSPIKWVMLMLLNYTFYYLIAGRWFWPLIAVTMTAYLYSVIQKRWGGSFYLAIVALLGLMIYLKGYINIFHPFNLESLNSQSVYGIFHFLIPIGFSVYWLQAIAYIVDIEKKKIQPISSFLEFAALSSYFPLTMNGPIVSYRTLGGALKTQSSSFDRQLALDGVLLLMAGFAKKIIIAERLASLIPNIFDYGLTPGTAVATVAIIPIYFLAEYSALIDLIGGTSKIMGIDLEKNYDTPLARLNFLELLKNWNTTLFHWIQEYLWEPLCSLSDSRRDKTIWMMALSFFISFWFCEKSKLFLVAMLLFQGVLMAYGFELIKEKLQSTIANWLINSISYLHSLLTFFLITFFWLAPSISVGNLILKQILKRDFKMFGSSQFDYLNIDVKIAFYFAAGLFLLEWLRPMLRLIYLKIPMLVKWIIFGLGLITLFIFYSNSVASFLFYRM